LALNYNATALNITVRDNGSGFVLPGISLSDNAGKAGLKNMQTRTKMIGGEMQIESVINKGTNLSFILPY